MSWTNKCHILCKVQWVEGLSLGHWCMLWGDLIRNSVFKIAWCCLRKPFSGLWSSVNLQLGLRLNIQDISGGSMPQIWREFFPKTKTGIVSRPYAYEVPKLHATWKNNYKGNHLPFPPPLFALGYQLGTFKDDLHKSVPLMAPRWLAPLNSVTRASAAGGASTPHFSSKCIISASKWNSRVWAWDGLIGTRCWLPRGHTWQPQLLPQPNFQGWMKLRADGNCSLGVESETVEMEKRSSGQVTKPTSLKETWPQSLLMKMVLLA